VIRRGRRSEGTLTMKGKKAVALGGCGGRPWLPTVVGSDVGAGWWRRVALGAAVGGLNRRRKEPELGRRL
jgi:hypothetical protein